MRNELWIISTLISVGVIGGLFYNWPQPAPHETDIQYVASKSKSTLAAESDSQLSTGPIEIADLEELRRQIRVGDNYLAVGNFENALTYFSPIYELFSNDASLLLRLGLTYELMQKPRRAAFFYRTAERYCGAIWNHRLVADLGLARCNSLLGKESEAMGSLCEIFLASSDLTDVDEQLKTQLSYQLATLLRKDAQHLYAPDSTVLEQPEHEVFEYDIAKMLSLLDVLAIATTQRDTSDNQIDERIEGVDAVTEPITLNKNRPDSTYLEIIQRPGNDIKLMVVEGYTRTMSVTELLENIATVTKLTIPVGELMKPYLTGRTTKIQSAAMPVAILLDCVLNPVNLAWSQEGLQIKLYPTASLTRTQLAAYRAQQSIRMGRNLVVNYPDNACSELMQLSIANLHFLLKEFDSASILLNQLADENKVGELNSKMRLSMGMLEQKFTRYEAAIEHYIAAVDQSADNRVKAMAYGNIARIRLAQDIIEPSIMAGSRSLSFTQDLSIRRQVALDLARAYLFANDPLSANRVLFEHSSAFGERRERALSLVYGAYARSLATLSPISKRKAIETLIIALAGIEGKGISDIDRVLLAKAYTQVGLIGKAVSILETSDTQPNNENTIWHRRLGYELASLLELDDQAERATQKFEELAADLSDSIGKGSQLALAEIELNHNNNPDKCLQFCRPLWAFELTEQMKKTILKTMGTAYQEKGNVHMAAYCFLGMLPDSDKPELAEKP